MSWITSYQPGQEKSNSSSKIIEWNLIFAHPSLDSRGKELAVKAIRLQQGASKANSRRFKDPLIIVNRKRIQKLVGGVSAAILCAASLSPVSAADAPAAAEVEGRALVVKDVDGKPHQPLVNDGQKATALFFVLHDCPLANSCAPEINRIVADYKARGVRSFLVYVEDDLSRKVARKHAREFGYACPVLLDHGQKLMRFARVTVSPEVAVLSPENESLYRGRIDDRLADRGKQRVSPTRRDLREALDEILEGKPVAVPLTKAVGCYLPTSEHKKQNES